MLWHRLPRTCARAAPPASRSRYTALAPCSRRLPRACAAWLRTRYAAPDPTLASPPASYHEPALRPPPVALLAKSARRLLGLTRLELEIGRVPARFRPAAAMSQAMVAIPLATGATATVRVSNIPPSAIASELLAFFDSAVAAAGVAFACKIVAAHRGWLSRGYGTVQFDSSAAAILATDLASSGRLPPFVGSRLHLPGTRRHPAPDLSLRFAGASLILGNRVAEREVEVAYTWDGVRAEIILAKRRVDLYLEHDSRKYRLEVLFEDIRECFGCSLDEMDAILLQLTYAPRIHTVISGPVVDSRFTDERFFACKEDNKFAWIRALDFTPNSSFGECSNLVLKLGKGAPVSDILKSLPFSGELGELVISSMDVFGTSSKVVPLVDCPKGLSVPYETLFRLNSMVHMGKLVARHVNADLFIVLEELSVDTARRIFEKMSKLKSTCYEPLQFIKQEAYTLKISKNALQSTDEMLTNKEAALSALGKIGGAETKRAVKMLLQGRGHVLIGCLDETGTLDYGQVYIRVTKTQKEQKDNEQPFFYDDDGETAVVVGKVAVSKNPCLHPGDIRVLEAVYDAGLDARGLVDCVVFLQRGERPHPNECSGGDLDGDLFFITWDDKLIPEKVDAPMDYAATRPHIMDHVVTLEEIHKNFVDYMINDTLGAISTAHLIHADRNPLKARSPECLQLAALHSMAVDFAKTGAPAQMPLSLRPREYPDFMERWEKPMYVSDGPMGKLYRAALRHAEDSDALLPEAPASRRAWRTLILTGNIRNKQLYLKRDNKRYFDMKDRIVAAVDALHDEVRGWLRECSDASRMASAWYHPDHRGEKRLWSFPWIACDNLLAIKEARGGRRRADGLRRLTCALLRQ
ncbi:hypothetical protein PR202_gb14913 [Eleusine coracana subsp. coracana]|uniref:RNA-dependent RNA polymerase n=1 Tax=Eleusine coracana subsp. coracana TaxID=191504 RepID=A0AAV5EWM7_ELECO|nr:hypothetical protein PR202_gb14913 [Eleusine coracana subsp. coracana]